MRLAAWHSMLLVTAGLSSFPSHAQTLNGSTNSPLNQPLQPAVPLPASGTAGGYFVNLRPIGQDFGRMLADKGIYVVGRDLSEEIGAASGGIKRGAFFEGYSSLGVDLDMKRIAGVAGGIVHVLVSDLQGQPYYSYSGSTYLNNRVYIYGPGLRLNEFSYEQSLFDDWLDLRAGRLTVGTEFDGSEFYCTLITSLCTTPAAYTFDKGYQAYLTSTWGGVAQVRLPGSFYVSAGVYENEPRLTDPTHGSFPGPDWGLNYADGATFPAQFGYRTTAKNDSYPRAFSVGGFINTGHGADPVLNTAGRNRILFGGPAKEDYGSSQIYVQAQQMVYRPDNSSDRGLSLFGGANWATGGQPVISRFAFVGAYYKGPFASRPRDTLSVAVSYLRLNPRITTRLDSLLASSSGGQSSRSEISYEANYALALAPGVAFKPFLQFISHPDQTASTAPSGNNTHAFFVGAAFTLLIPDTFGLPTLPLH